MLLYQTSLFFLTVGVTAWALPKKDLDPHGNKYNAIVIFDYVY